MICYSGSTENSEEADIFVPSWRSRFRCLIRDQNADLELTCKLRNTSVL